MQLHDLILALVAFFTEALSTLSGVSSSALFIPLAQYFESMQVVLILTALLHSFGNISRIWMFKKDINWNYFFKLALPSIFLAGIGALFNNIIPMTILNKILGITLVLISSLIFFEARLLKVSDIRVSVFFSGVSGLLTGLVGTGGVLRTVALSTLQLSKTQFVALSSSIDVLGDLLRAAVYLKNGYMDWAQWYYIPLIAVAAYFGSILGKKFLDRINQSTFNKFITAFLFVNGLIYLYV